MTGPHRSAGVAQGISVERAGQIVGERGTSRAHERPHRYSTSYSTNYGRGCWGCAVAQGRSPAATPRDGGILRCTTTRPPRRSEKGVRVVVQLRMQGPGVAAGERQQLKAQEALGSLNRRGVREGKRVMRSRGEGRAVAAVREVWR
jgi:hypothetical protein